MTRIASIAARYLIAAATSMGAIFWNGEVSLNGQTGLVSSAQAVIGRPLTPVSYAGVARRTTRRTVAVGAAAAETAAAAATVAAKPAWVQSVNAYGQITYVCP